MKTHLRQQAVDFRLKEQLSYTEIRKRLGVPKSTLSYWLSEFPLSEEKILSLRRQGWQKGEASRERFRITMCQKAARKAEAVYLIYAERFKKIYSDVYFVAGLMLYLGEGDKKNPNRVALSNTDPRIIRFFIKWLGEFLEVSQDLLRIQLHLYDNMNIEKEEHFWREQLGISRGQFYKTQIRRFRDGNFSYKGPDRHGTCSLFLSSHDKKREISMAIKAFLDRYEQNS